MLFGRETFCRLLSPGHNPPTTYLHGLFRDDAGRPAAAVGCDLETAARSAAALSLMPMHHVRAALDQGQLDEVLLGNLHEVFNVLSSLLNHDHLPHLTLRGISVAGDPGLAGLTEEAPLKAAFEVELPSFGRGTLVFTRPWAKPPPVAEEAGG